MLTTALVLLIKSGYSLYFGSRQFIYLEEINSLSKQHFIKLFYWTESMTIFLKKMRGRKCVQNKMTD